MSQGGFWRFLLNPWVAVGFLGQAVFTARFLVQWLASERRRDSVMPVAFWWLSLAGGLILLTYAVVHLKDPVISVGQGMGLVVYIRNLMLVGKAKRREARRRKRVEALRPKGLGKDKLSYRGTEARRAER
jgi:lipid-A-disaccharide synthase-like uncharacterized protein